MFDPIAFQPEIWDRLRKIIQSGRIGSAYLFNGPEGSAKEATALAFAAALNCHNNQLLCGRCTSCIRFNSLQHEHLSIILPLPREKNTINKDTDVLSIIGQKNEKLLTELLQQKGQDPFLKIKLPKAKRILINSIRDLREKLYLRSVEQGYKIVLLFDAHYLSAGDGASANALLKLLEEPPVKTTIILVTDHRVRLLSTIQSRCQQIDFPPLSDDVIRAYLSSTDPTFAELAFIAFLADGNIQRARYFSTRKSADIITAMKDQLEVVINNNGDIWRQYINKMARWGRDNQNEFKFQLFLLQKWCQQAMRMKNELPAELARNGMAAQLETFMHSFPDANLAQANIVIEETIDAIEKNVYMPLSVTNMLIQIQQHLHGENRYE